MRVWNAYFSNLYTESDKPQCPECFELKGVSDFIFSCLVFNSHIKGKIKNARKNNDQVLMIQLEKEKTSHIKNAR
ncbi:MAG: hypothetical protein K0R16_914 [Nitrososphaeraceae archaeon]|jgi:hypothetical protein|nr:hypothetical protein [Nitrososphaeraceae archaeon]